jgi:atypical dual specificity phosphatase
MAPLEGEAAPLLKIEGLTFGFGERVILKDIDLEIPPRGVFGIMGPAGVGKSTFLRTLARWSEALPNFWYRGAVHCRGRDLLRDWTAEEVHQQVALLNQKARLYTATVLDNLVAEVRRKNRLTLARKRWLAERILAVLGLTARFRERLDCPVLQVSLGEQRMLSLARLAAGGARCLMADEPLSDIAAEEAAELHRLLRLLGQRRAVIVVTHNQQIARTLCDAVCLLAAQRVVEVAPRATFFTAPATELAREYLRSGNCWPSEPEREPTPEAAARWRPPAHKRALRPGGFHWVLPNQLGGAQRPGLIQEERQDLEGLAALGCRILVSLTQKAYAADKLRALSIEGVHFPVVDMAAPTVAAAAELCRRIDHWLAAAKPTVLHCRAGLGRTGTLLAAYLIHRGANAVHAIEEVRSINPHYIQSQAQLDFLAAFGEHISNVPAVASDALVGPPSS